MMVSVSMLVAGWPPISICGIIGGSVGVVSLSLPLLRSPSSSGRPWPSFGGVVGGVSGFLSALAGVWLWIRRRARRLAGNNSSSNSSGNGGSGSPSVEAPLVPNAGAGTPHSPDPEMAGLAHATPVTVAPAGGYFPAGPHTPPVLYVRILHIA